MWFSSVSCVSNSFPHTSQFQFSSFRSKLSSSCGALSRIALSFFSASVSSSSFPRTVSFDFPSTKRPSASRWFRTHSRSACDGLLPFPEDRTQSRPYFYSHAASLRPTCSEIPKSSSSATRQ